MSRRCSPRAKRGCPRAIGCAALGSRRAAGLRETAAPSLARDHDEAYRRRADLDHVARALAVAAARTSPARPWPGAQWSRALRPLVPSFQRSSGAVRERPPRCRPGRAGDRGPAGCGEPPVSAARRLHAAWWIGKSVRDFAAAEAAQAEGPTIFWWGPSTPRRPTPIALLWGSRPSARSRGWAAGDRDWGISPARARAVRAAGAYGAAAIRALWDAADPADAARRMSEELQ